LETTPAPEKSRRSPPQHEAADAASLPVIRLRAVTKSHRHGPNEVRALRGISAEIEAGSFTFIVGPSGSGKSTLLYLIGALDEPSSGEILVDDRPLSRLTTAQRDKYRRNDVGFIFQNFNLLANLTAVENALVPFLPAGISTEMRRRAVELLTQVGLKNRLDHRPNELSGGEQQRVAIVRAVMKKPKIVLADEPTGELDSATGAEVFGHLRRLHEEQRTTVLVVTHDQRYITPSDSVLRLQDGTLADGV
jgi:putative ABC transport system ATP-binding protein